MQQQQQQLNVFMHQSFSLLLSSLHTMASLKTLSQAFSLARNAHKKTHTETQRDTKTHTKSAAIALGVQEAQREGGREEGGKRVAKELFYPDTERRKKVEREPPRNAEGGEKGSKKVGLKPPRTGEGEGQKGDKELD
jgi:hypothetical protein